MKNALHIMYQCDNYFAFLAGVSFTSLVLNADENIKYYVYILTPDMSEENKKKFREAAELRTEIQIELFFLDATMCEKEVMSWKVPAHRGSWVTYYKLLLDHYFSESDVEKIIHIGADTLVTGSLKDLIDFDFEGKPIAMNWSSKERERHFPRYYRYCIAEMVYFNLPEWRKHRCEERIKQHFIKIGDIYGSKDQGILNMEFQNECAQLPLKYNIYGITVNFYNFTKRWFNDADIITKEEIGTAYSKPEIIHIPRTFLYRPHEKDSLDPMKQMWWEYCEKSPWKDMESLEPFPKLGAKERLIRFVYMHLPKCLAEIFYIICRRGYQNMVRIMNPPLAENDRRIDNGFTQ